MSWSALISLIAEEVGMDAAKRIEERARREMGGVRLTILARKQISATDVQSAGRGDAERAARVLGVHRSTIYRAMRKPLVR